MEQTEKWVLAEAVQSFYQAPLYHLILEGLLIIWIIHLLFSKSYKLSSNSSLTNEEKKELICDWQPEALVPPLEKTYSNSVPYRLVTGRPCKVLSVDGHSCLNFASMNFLGLTGNSRIEKEASECIRKYGVGSCGPRAFYGTVDVHVELEIQLASFMKTERAIVYSYGFAAIASSIPAYAKRGDIIFADEAVNFAIQKGLHASRSKIVYFKHNDLEDLEGKLQLQEKIDQKDPKKASVTRKFMIVEGIYMNSGQLCDLPKLVELKYRYKARIFIDESLSFGTLGAHGRGVTEHFKIPIGKIDLVCASMEYSLASTGGFCCGRAYVIDHQCLSGQGYVFSASLPPLLARAAIEGLKIMDEDPEMFVKLQTKARKMQQLLKHVAHVKLVGYPDSPSFHLACDRPASPQEDFDFLSRVVENCLKNGVCLTINRRLKHEEAVRDWPVSIRVAVSVEMSDDDIIKAVDVINQSVIEAHGNGNIN